MRNRIAVKATKVATATAKNVVRTSTSVSTDERIIQLRRELGMGIKEAARDYKLRTNMKALNLGLLN